MIVCIIALDVMAKGAPHSAKAIHEQYWSHAEIVAHHRLKGLKITDDKHVAVKQ